MKKLLQIILFPLLWLNKLVRCTNWYKNTIPDLDNYPTNDWYRKHSERNYDIVNIGSSSAVFAFDYSETGLKAFNWALQPQSMEYGFRLLKNYFSILREDGIVMIPLSPFSGLNVGGKWRSNANDRYYYLLDRTLIDNYKEVAKRRRYPLFTSPIQALKRLLKDVPKKSHPNCKICKTDEEFERDSKQWIGNWMKEFNISDLEAPLTEENKRGMTERIKLLSDIISFCHVRGLRPVIIMPPMHPTLAEQFSCTFRNSYIYYALHDITSKGVLFLDYWKDSRFMKDEYFYNSFFMNKIGAKIFTKQVSMDLQKSHKIKGHEERIQHIEFGNSGD